MDFADLWIPTSVADLVDAVARGSIREDHFHDGKRKLPPATPVANVDLAVDLASFAVHGGHYYVGLDEQKNGTFKSTPTELEGLAERIEQIARSRVDAPLRVTTRLLRLSNDPTRGHASSSSPSPDAPHQVDGVYRGRGDRTNIRLSDVEVRRIIDERRSLVRDIEHITDAEVARDPLAPPAIRRRRTSS